MYFSTSSYRDITKNSFYKTFGIINTSDLSIILTNGLRKHATNNDYYTWKKISFTIYREFKSFTDKQKLREFSTTKPALQQILKDLHSQ